jgi:hypothetical protein
MTKVINVGLLTLIAYAFACFYVARRAAGGWISRLAHRSTASYADEKSSGNQRCCSVMPMPENKGRILINKIKQVQPLISRSVAPTPLKSVTAHFYCAVLGQIAFAIGKRHP